MKKILLVTDNDRWAFHNIASHMQEELSDKFDIDIIAMEKLNGNVVDLLLLGNDYDVIHFYWRGYLMDLENDFSKSYIYNLGLSFEEFVEKYIKNKVITTCVYDHKIQRENEIDKYLKFSNDYYVSSKILKAVYDNLNIIRKPSAIINDGIDLKMFYPNAEEKKKTANRKLRIGWVGNSNWDGESDHKGLNTIIKPCVERLIEENYNVELYIADSKEKLRPIEEMCNYYHEIDLYLCCSINEGTPNPVLEAMACGLPIISTDVGIVREAFGTKQKKFIMKERSVEELYNKIVEILEDKDLLKTLGEENIHQIEKWDWKYKARDFEKFINKNLR